MSFPLIQKILVVINGTEDSIKAAEYGILLAKTYHCELKAIYVVDTASLRKLELRKIFVSEETETYSQGMETNGTNYLNYVEDLAKEKGIKIETELRRGLVWAEVVNVAKSDKSNLILIGGIDYAGSSTQDPISMTYREILINSPCSVLMVREEMIDSLFRMS